MKKGVIIESGDKDKVLYNSEDDDVKKFMKYQIIRNTYGKL